MRQQVTTYSAADWLKIKAAQLNKGLDHYFIYEYDDEFYNPYKPDLKRLVRTEIGGSVINDGLNELYIELATGKLAAYGNEYILKTVDNKIITGMRTVGYIGDEVTLYSGNLSEPNSPQLAVQMLHIPLDYKASNLSDAGLMFCYTYAACKLLQKDADIRADREQRAAAHRQANTTF